MKRRFVPNPTVRDVTYVLDRYESQEAANPLERADLRLKPHMEKIEKVDRILWRVFLAGVLTVALLAAIYWWVWA